jgi:hypothetical protein
MPFSGVPFSLRGLKSQLESARRQDTDLDRAAGVLPPSSRNAQTEPVTVTLLKEVVAPE